MSKEHAVVNVLFFCNGKYDFEANMYSEIEVALKRKGLRMILIDISRKDAMESLKSALNVPILFAMGFNGQGLQFRLVGQDKAETDLYEKYNFPYVAILGDPPFNPVTHSVFSKCAHLLVAYIDLSHFKYLQMVFPAGHIKMSFFLPWGGTKLPQLTKETVMNTERKYPISFCGTHYFAGKGFRLWRQYDSGINFLLDGVADFIISQKSISIFDAFQYVLHSRGFEDPAILKACMRYFNPMYVFVRNYRRTRCIETLVQCGFEINVWGNGWEKTKFAQKLRLHGVVSYQKLLEVCKNTKILLNENASFDEGSSERAFSAMLQGAAFVTDYSRYYAENFQNGVELELYEWDQLKKLPHKVLALLTNEEKRRDMAERAYEKVLSAHTWENSVNRILEMVHIYRFSMKGPV